MPKANKYTKPEKALSKMDLGELAQLRKQWIREALDNGDLDLCLKVGRELGERGDSYPSSPTRIPPFRWRAGDVTVHYSKIEVLYPKHLQQAVHGDWELVIVALGGRSGFELLESDRVCFYLFGEEDDHEVYTQYNRFIPGKWIKFVRDVLPEADRAIKAKVLHSQENKRLALAELLLIGKEV